MITDKQLSMKRIIILVFLCAPYFSAWGQNSCDKAMDTAISLYKAGKYREAKMQFEWCRSRCNDRSDTTYKSWLDSCEVAIKKQVEAHQRSIHLEQEAIKRREAEAIAKAERREKNRYIFLSSFSTVPGKFTNIEYEIEDKLRNLNSDFRFTRDTTEAYWFVHIAVNIRDDMSNSGDAHFYYVDATVEVENAAMEQIGRSYVDEKDGSFTIPIDRAEEWTANKIYANGTLLNKIVESITKYIKP